MKSDIRGSRIPYHKLGVFPYFVGYCDSEAGWTKEMARINAPHHFDLPLGAVTYRFHNCGGYHLSIVIVNRKHYHRRELSELVGALAHESTHVVQNFMARIGEESPSAEFQAYMIEDVTRWLFAQHRSPPR